MVNPRSHLPFLSLTVVLSLSTVVLLIAPHAAQCSDPASVAYDCLCESPVRLTGPVCDCGCEAENVETLNAVHILPEIHKLLNSTFFSYFKLNLGCECPFWPDDGMCALRACAVDSACSDQEVPKEKKINPDTMVSTRQKTALSRIDDFVDQGKFTQWEETSNVWTQLEQEDKSTFVSLHRNPERFTGYAGANARRIWKAIYDENCFELSELECTEKRVFYRVISGLHASISAHLSYDFMFKDGTWGPNLELFDDRVGKHKDRLENMYFVYLVVLRSVMRAGPALLNYDFDTEHSDDAFIPEYIKALTSPEAVADLCPMTFDESQLFRGPDAAVLRDQVRSKFYNISRIMDCVGCDRCKLWGKVQTLGIGTALKLLFTEDDLEGEVKSLHRSEVIALFNVLGRLSESVEIATEMRALRLRNVLAGYGTGAVLSLFLALFVILVVKVCRRRKRRQANSVKESKKND
eukprot:TRINITY_DN37533_c0_g1_i2.p1 TRINITY_DN37533_c0_g1~~TRINITY_DN37533_c0_g1_i2.p1  ORF type:complete len:465 (-),score=59.98 TRINITY_DN37533_c0_g1_i2:47-1441(-)